MSSTEEYQTTHGIPSVSQSSEKTEVFELNEEPKSGVSAGVDSSSANEGVVLSSLDEDFLGQLEEIPDKMAFKIGEVADIVGVKQYVLRYWETEFQVLRPKKSNHNQRMYTRKDVEMIFLIKKLLYKDRFSITGARGAIKKLKKNIKPTSEKRQTYRKYLAVIEKAKALVRGIERLEQKLG